MATNAPVTNGTSTVPGDAEYFANNPKPWTLRKHSTLARAFIEEHAASNRRVALVTSGGTTVPLENQTVRFIDNFSAGTRGACSAEYFIKEGYAVIFLHRQFSLLPFSRHYSHTTNCFLDYMVFNDAGAVVIDHEYQQQMGQVLEQYRRAKKENTLLLLPFVTVNDYLWTLRELAMLMQPLGAHGLFYLAAAVSDFFVPAARMAEHKIQSSEDFHKEAAANETAQVPAARMEDQRLVIDLDPVPKFLKVLVDRWAPQSMIISFKLETDPSLLARKARHALKKYAHHLVIGNMLHSRKWEVLFVSADGKERWIRIPANRRTKSVTGRNEDGSIGTADSGEPSIEIESVIVPDVAILHGQMIEKGQVGSGAGTTKLTNDA